MVHIYAQRPVASAPAGAQTRLGFFVAADIGIGMGPADFDGCIAFGG